MPKLRHLVAFAPLASLASLLACAGSRTPGGSGAGGSAAASPAASSRAKAGDGELVCQLETPIGSHIPERTCHRRSTLETRRQLTQDELRLLHGQSPLQSQ